MASGAERAKSEGQRRSGGWILAASQPDGRCQKVELAWDGTPFECMLFGQQALARWLEENPGHVIRRGYRCVPGREV